MENIVEKFNICSHKLYDSMGHVVYDSNKNYKSSAIRGKLKCIGSDGSVLFAHNQTIYPGRKFILEKLFGKNSNPSQSYYLDDVLAETYENTDYRTVTDETATTNDADRVVRYFGVGVGGCGIEYGDVVSTSTNAVMANGLIPLRVVESLNGFDTSQYKLCIYKQIGNKNYYCFYLKKFAEPDINVKLYDNNGGSTNYSPTGSQMGIWTPSIASDQLLALYPIQTYVSIALEVSEYDLKEYYYAGENKLTNCRFNELCLFTAKETQVSLTTPQETHVFENEVVNVEAFSHLTFNNRPMDSDGASYSFTYTMTT